MRYEIATQIVGFGMLQMIGADAKRRLRGAFRNSVVWGVAWGVLGTTVTATMRLFDGIPLLNAIGDGIGMGIRIGVMGGIAGAAFSTFISVAYHKKRLAELSALRFGIGGAVVAGLFVPAFMQTMNIVFGDGPVPWGLLYFDIAIAAFFGGVTAGGTIKLAQHAESLAPLAEQDALDAPERAALPAIGNAAVESAQREFDRTAG